MQNNLTLIWGSENPFAGAEEEEGEILRFRNAVLARAETNLNMDAVDATGIAELAAGLPLMPIDIEHQDRALIGTFVEAAVEQDTLLTGGIIYARRFPEITMQLRQGIQKLSIEANAEVARCGACNKEFRTRADYCEHLSASMKERREKGWVRHLRGLSALGGAVTRKPAGTGTEFDRNAFRMIATVEPTQADDLLAIKLMPVFAKYGYYLIKVG